MENTAISPNETAGNGKICLVCRTNDSSHTTMTGCSTGEHYLCRGCFDKIGSSQNVCIFCNMMPVAESTSITPDTFAAEEMHACIKNSPVISLNAAQACCTRHPSESAYFFCIPCNRPACDKCVTGLCATHKHYFVAKQSAPETRFDTTSMREQAARRSQELGNIMRIGENATMQLRCLSSKARLDVDAAYSFFFDQLRNQRVKLLGEVETIFNGRWQRINVEMQEVRTQIEHLDEFVNVVNTFALSTSNSGAPDVAMFAPIYAKLKSSLDELLLFQPKLTDAASWVGELEFLSNRQAMQVAVQNCLGYVRQGQGESVENGISVLAKLNTSSSTPVIMHSVSYDSPGSPMSAITSSVPKLAISKAVGVDYCVNAMSNGKGVGYDRNQSAFWPNDLGGYLSSGDFGSGNGAPGSIFSATVGAEKKNGVDLPSAPEAWQIPTLNNSGIYQSNDSLLDSLSQSGAQPIPVGLSTIKRQKMGYHCKFGEFGSRPGQFTEPSGITTNTLNDIIVADTNNHRLEVFDATGVFKYEILGRQADCELVYPNRLAVCRTTGDIIVTERSPTHQVQVFDRCGNFLRRFGGKVLQHPRGVAVDQHERIVVVECRVMRVVIFDVVGAVINRFSLMGELEFPNGVAVDDKEQIYISDNRAHCVKVYNYTGAFVRTIGGPGITNYPIGVGVDRFGRVVVADNHNNFNVTVFDSDGTMIRALESRVKHAHCYDMALTGDGDIVVSSKDFRVYVYRYETTAAGPELVASGSGGSGGYQYM